MSGKQSPWGREKELEAARLKARGRNFADIARHFNISKMAVSRKFGKTGFVYLSDAECFDLGVRTNSEMKEMRSGTISGAHPDSIYC